MIELLLTLTLSLPQQEIQAGIPKVRSKRARCIQGGGTWKEQTKTCKWVK